MGIDNVEDLGARVQYVASAAQTTFDYPFPIFEDADLVVDIDGTTKTLTSDYSVTGAGADTGGTIVLVVATVGGEIVTIYRQTAITRTTDFQQNGPLSSKSFNDQLDKLTVIAQELDAAIQRCLRIPTTAEVDDADIELLVANWANNYLTFDVNGKPTPAALSSSTMTQATIGNLLYPRTAAEQSAGVTPTNYFYPPGDVRRYGAVGDGSTDDTTAFQNITAVINAAGTGDVILEHNKNYKVWVGASPQLMYFSNCTGVNVIGNGATLTSGRTNGPQVFAIQFSGCARCTVENLTVVGSNTTLASSTGESLINCKSATTDIHVKNCKALNCRAGISCGNGDDPGSSRTSRISVLNFYCNSTYYGINCANDGDDLFVRNFVTYNAGRSYFPWNVKNHDVHVSSSHGGPFSDCLLKVYVNTTWPYTKLENIRLKYHTDGRASIGTNQNADEAMIAVDVQQVDTINTGAATMSNIDIQFDVEASATPTHRRLFTMRRYTSTGEVDTTSRSHIFSNWRFSGRVASAQNFTEDVFTIFSNLGTWTGDLATGFLLENILISGSDTQNGIVINGAPFLGYASSLMLNNVTTDTDISLSGAGQDAPVTFNNVAADNLRLYSTTTYDPGSLADGAGSTTTMNVTGAQLGDAVECSFSNNLQGITLTAWVSAADTVSIRFQNESGGTLDLASGILRVWLRKRAI